jgi:hypothetical protein
MWSIVTVCRAASRNFENQSPSAVSRLAELAKKGRQAMRALLKWKKAWSIAILVALLFSMSLPAFASSVIDRNRIGSITINLSAADFGGDVSPSGVRFTIYKVAALSDSGKYDLTNDFLDSGLDLAKLTTAYEASATSKELANYVSAKKINGITNATDANGTVSFQNLSLGYYLVLQSYDSSNPNFGIICDPFLVAVPMKNESDGNLIYDIVTNSKSEPSCGAVILQKVNDAGKFLPDAVFRLEKKVYTSESIPSGVESGRDSKGTYYWKNVMISLTTNRSGQLAVNGLTYGEYRFIETSAPDGYILDPTPHEFQINQRGSAALINGKYTATSGTVQMITVTNCSSPPSSSEPPAPSSTSSSGFNFPKTGGSVFYAVCTLVGAILMAGGVTLFVISKRKKKRRLDIKAASAIELTIHK